MVIWAPIPSFPELRCSICGIVKEKLDKNDNLVVDVDKGIAKGTWYCPKGHANNMGVIFINIESVKVIKKL